MEGVQLPSEGALADLHGQASLLLALPLAAVVRLAALLQQEGLHGVA